MTWWWSDDVWWRKHRYHPTTQSPSQLCWWYQMANTTSCAPLSSSFVLNRSAEPAVISHRTISEHNMLWSSGKRWQQARIALLTSPAVTSHLLDNDGLFPIQALMSFVYRLAGVRGHRSTWSGCIMREAANKGKHWPPVVGKCVGLDNSLSSPQLCFSRDKHVTVRPLAGGRAGTKCCRAFPAFTHVTVVMWVGHWPLSSSCRSEGKAVSASVSAVKRRSPRWRTADSSINTDSTS